MLYAAKCLIRRSAPGKSSADGNAFLYKSYDLIRNSSSLIGKSNSPRGNTRNN